jgi:hypothetical protein
VVGLFMYFFYFCWLCVSLMSSIGHCIIAGLSIFLILIYTFYQKKINLIRKGHCITKITAPEPELMSVEFYILSYLIMGRKKLKIGTVNALIRYIFILTLRVRDEPVTFATTWVPSVRHNKLTELCLRNKLYRCKFCRVHVILSSAISAN